MGLSEVPLENNTDLKPSPGHVARTLRGHYEASLPDSMHHFTHGALDDFGAGFRPVQRRAHDDGEVLRGGQSGGQRVNSECTPGLDRPLCNYHSISFNIFNHNIEYNIYSMQIHLEKRNKYI